MVIGLDDSDGKDRMTRIKEVTYSEDKKRERSAVDINDNLDSHP